MYIRIYTFGLTYHLKKHESAWNEYLIMLGDTIVPDTRTKFEHFKAMEKPSRNYSKEESRRSYQEVQRNYSLNKKNCAGVFYNPKDSQILKNTLHEFSKGENAKIWKYLYPYTNQNVHIFQLMGMEHGSAPLFGKYKRSKCLVDNTENITLDLERLLCENICFFDPEFYD